MARFEYVKCKRGDTVPKDAIRDFGISAVGPYNYIYARAKCPSGDYVLGVATTVSDVEPFLKFPAAMASAVGHCWFGARNTENQETVRPKPAKAKKHESDEEVNKLQECHYFDKTLGEYTCTDEFEVLTSQAKLRYVHCKTGSAPPNGAIVGCFNDRTGPSYYAKCFYHEKLTGHEQGVSRICYGTARMTTPFSNALEKAWAFQKLHKNKGFDEFDVLILDEKDEIEKVEFDDHRAETVSEPRVLKSMEQRNNSSKPLMRKFTYNESVTDAITLTHDFGAFIEPGTEITCTRPSLTQHRTKFNVDEQYKIQWGKQKIIPKSYNGTINVQIPPNFATKYSAVVTKTTLTVPVRIHWLSGNVTVGTWYSVSHWGFEINHVKKCLVDMDAKIESVVFDIKKAKTHSSPKVVATQTLTNNTNIDQANSFTYTKEETTEKYFEYECGTEIKVATEFKCGLPIIAEGKVELEAEVSYKGIWGEKISSTLSFETSVPVNVPANSAVTCTAEFTEEILEVPYKIHLSSGKVSKGKWHSVRNYNSRTKFEQKKLKPNHP